jgi:hypothetical protein
MHPEEFPNDLNDPGELSRALAVADRLDENNNKNAAETIRRLVRRVERRDHFIATMRSKLLVIFDTTGSP